MAILAIDTALAACSAAVWRHGTLHAHRFEERTRGHAETIMPMIEACMAEADLPYGALDCLAVSIGPGTYTGLRVGHAAIRGLALAAEKPVIGISCMEAVACATVRRMPTAPSDMAVVLSTRRADIYVQMFRNGVGVGAAQALPRDAIVALLPDHPVLLAGDAAEALAAGMSRPDVILAPGRGLPDAADVAELADAHMARSGLPPRFDFPTPLYLRAPDVTLSGSNVGLRPPQ